MYDLVFIHTGFYDNELAWPAELGSYSSACNPEIQQLRGHHLGRAKKEIPWGCRVPNLRDQEAPNGAVCSWVTRQKEESLRAVILDLKNPGMVWS